MEIYGNTLQSNREKITKKKKNLHQQHPPPKKQNKKKTKKKNKTKQCFVKEILLKQEPQMKKKVPVKSND